jgi:hypothetical protein
MKSPEGKARWRKFCMGYEKSLADYNMGSIIRTDSHGGYTEENSIFVVRAQFVAIEIARNRTGLNDFFYEEAQKAKAAAKASSDERERVHKSEA